MRQKFQIFNSKTIFAPASPASVFFFHFAAFSFFFMIRFVVFVCCSFCFFFSRLNNLQIEAETGSCRHSDNDNRMLNESFSCHRRSLALAKLCSGSGSGSATALCHRRVCWLCDGKMKTNNNEKRQTTTTTTRRGKQMSKMPRPVTELVNLAQLGSSVGIWALAIRR